MNRELSSEALTVLASACQVTLRAEIGSETRSAIWLATGRSGWFAEDVSADDRQLLSEVGEPDPDDVGWCHAPVGELTAMVLDLDRPDALDVLDEESGDWLALGENLLALWSDNGRRVALLIDDFELHSPFERSTVIATAFLGLVAKGIGYGSDLIAFLALPPYTDEDSGEDGATTNRLVGIEDRVAWWKQLGFAELAGGLVVRPF